MFRAVTIQSSHDMISIMILTSQYNMYHNTIFIHKSQIESFDTLGKQVQNHLKGSFLCNNACVRCPCLSYKWSVYDTISMNLLPLNMFCEEIRIGQSLSYIAFCSLRILYHSKVILMAISWGMNVVVVTSLSFHNKLFLCFAHNKCSSWF